MNKPTSAKPNTIPAIADKTVIDLASRRAASKSRPRLEGSRLSGTLGAMPETSGLFRCPVCHNDKFYVFVSDFPWELTTSVYCESLQCDYTKRWSQVKLK